MHKHKARDTAHTGQGEQLVADKNGRFVLVFVQSILTPVAQELFHGTFQFSSYALMKMMLCGSDAGYKS